MTRFREKEEDKVQAHLEYRTLSKEESNEEKKQ